MSKELTDKTWVLVAMGLGRIYLNDKEAELAKKALTENGNNNASIFVIGDSTIRISAIQGIVRASEMENKDRLKRGDFKCKYDEWHDRGMTCNCAELRFYRRN